MLLTCLKTYFVYRKLEYTGDRQEFHTDRTLHMGRNVQGTDRNNTMMEHYTCKGMYREYHTDRTLIHIIRNVQGQTGTDNAYNREFHNWPFQTHTQSQIVAY